MSSVVESLTLQDAATAALTEPQFVALVEALSADQAGCEQLADLLREDHLLYDQRGSATVVRMRGWILLALARAGLTEASLLFVLEELDAGRDPYLVAAAARALRAYPDPSAAFAPFVMRAIANVRYHDEPVTFDRYGQYATASSAATSAVRELIATKTWLGPHARGVAAELEALRAAGDGLAKKFRVDLDRAVAAIGDGGDRGADDAGACCQLPGGLGHLRTWSRDARRDGGSIESTRFEDHDGASITFGEYFRGKPSIVVFFYTRCDNPQKCSLTVAKLARIQNILAERGLADRIRTSAITYDPAFDLPDRLRGYGKSRGVRMDAGHRLLRAADGADGVAVLRRHCSLGVNFIESLVNRHRLEVYVLDRDGRIAASFERIHWDEEQVVDQAAALVNEPAQPEPVASTVAPIAGASASLAIAFFPKCPVCWTAYMSVIGIGGLEQVPYSPWLRPALVVLMLLNVLSVWVRGRTTGRMIGFYLVAAGAMTILLSKTSAVLGPAAAAGVLLTVAGSLVSAMERHLAASINRSSTGYNEPSTATLGPRERSGPVVIRGDTPDITANTSWLPPYRRSVSDWLMSVRGRSFASSSQPDHSRSK